MIVVVHSSMLSIHFVPFCFKFVLRSSSRLKCDCKVRFCDLLSVRIREATIYTAHRKIGCNCIPSLLFYWKQTWLIASGPPLSPSSLESRVNTRVCNRRADRFIDENMFPLRTTRQWSFGDVGKKKEKKEKKFRTRSMKNSGKEEVILTNSKLWRTFSLRPRFQRISSFCGARI